ncbi:MAG: GHKL domain-containing protein [bacterium]|nr:GHKL domain-containing protein [bacterium]
MNLREILLDMIQFLVVIPAAVICYMPMKNQLRYSGIKIFLLIAAACCLFVPSAALLRSVFSVNANTIIFIALTAFFMCFQATVKTDIIQSLTVFIFTCGLTAFPANFAYTFDAWLHPSGNYLDFSWEAALFQLVLTSAMALAFAYPLRRWGSSLIDRVYILRVWRSILAVSFILLLVNIAIIPHSYSTLYVGRCFPLYIMILFVLLSLTIMLHITFYHIITGILKNADLSEQIQFFEMEERQYRLQQRYIEETSKQRHDFRQSVFTLQQLAENGDLESIKEYLYEYANSLPIPHFVNYCKNNAVNAVLNHYAYSAEQSGIAVKWTVSLPNTLTIAEPDLCSLLGNLIENAVSGCMTLTDKSKRFHYMSVTVRNDVNLYIVSTNSFDGGTKMKGSSYLSTKRSGSGIGIHSVEMIAEKYHGTARFSHTAGEFYADVMLKLP